MTGFSKTLLALSNQNKWKKRKEDSTVEKKSKKLPVCVKKRISKITKKKSKKKSRK